MRFSDAIFRPKFSLIDTHCHYNLEPIYENWQSSLESAKNRQVDFSWIPGTNLETSRRAVALSQQEESFTAFIGVHPGEIEDNEFDLDITLSQLRRIKEEAEAAGRPIGGVGEVGLDYFRLAEDPQTSGRQKEEQRWWLRRQLHLAKEWNLPVILHVRDRETPEEPTPDNAYWDTCSIVQEIGLETDFTMHCVSGPMAYVTRMLEMGAYAGFDGNISYPSAHHIRALWRLVPAERRLLETDAPFLPPQGFRGQTCEPWMIRETAEFIERELS